MAARLLMMGIHASSAAAHSRVTVASVLRMVLMQVWLASVDSIVALRSA